MEQRWKGWFDFGYFLSPIVYKVLYIFCSVGVVIGGAYYVYVSWTIFDTLLKVGVIIGILVSPFIVRVLFESFLLLYRINNNLTAIADMLEQWPRHEAPPTDYAPPRVIPVPSRPIPVGPSSKTESRRDERPIVQSDWDMHDRPVQEREEVPKVPVQTEQSEASLQTEEPLDSKSRRLDEIFSAPPVRRQ